MGFLFGLMVGFFVGFSVATGDIDLSSVTDDIGITGQVPAGPSTGKEQ